MEKIGFIVDSTCYLPQQYLDEHHIKVVSLNVIEEDQTHKELEIDNQFVFDKLDQKVKLTTSQPSPSEFLEVYEEAFKKGYTKLLVLTISQGLSGTYQSAVLAKSMLEDKDSVHVFDSQNAAYGNELLAMQIASLIQEGKTSQVIIKHMESIFEHAHLMFTVENLFSLQKGGRLSKTQALLGTVLRVKPVIKIIEGKLQLYHKERTHKKIHSFFIDEIAKDPNFGEKKTLHVRIIQRNSEENAEALNRLIVEKFNKVDISINDYLGPVFSIHVGPKGFGLCWFFK